MNCLKSNIIYYLAEEDIWGLFC